MTVLTPTMTVLTPTMTVLTPTMTVLTPTVGYNTLKFLLTYSHHGSIFLLAVLFYYRTHPKKRLKMRLLFPIAAPSHHTIKALFLRSGITHAELAMLAGVSDSSWFRYLSGQSPMPYENWLALNAQIYMINTGVDLYWNAPRDVLNLAPAPKPPQKNYDVVLPKLEGAQIFDVKEAAVQNTPKETESERRRLDTERLDARAARFSVEYDELKADYEADRNSLSNVPDMHIDLRIEFTKDKRKKMDALCTQYGMYDDQYENDIEQLNQYKLSRKRAREAKLKEPT